MWNFENCTKTKKRDYNTKCKKRFRNTLFPSRFLVWWYFFILFFLRVAHAHTPRVYCVHIQFNSRLESSPTILFSAVQSYLGERYTPAVSFLRHTRVPCLVDVCSYRIIERAPEWWRRCIHPHTSVCYLESSLPSVSSPSSEVPKSDRNRIQFSVSVDVASPEGISV